MHHHASVIAIAVLAAACESTDPPPAIVYPVPYNTRVEIRSESVPAPATATPSTAVSVDIVVTTARKLDRPTEVVGIIDAHEPSGRQDAAYAALRRRAAEMGADAVVGVEFHHGEEKDEPTHFSGLAVRYLNRNP